MNFFRLGVFFISLCIISTTCKCGETEADDELLGRIHSINLKTESTNIDPHNKDFTKKYLDEAILLVKHRTKVGTLDTLPYTFVKKQITRVEKFIPKEKSSLLKMILSDLLLSGPVDRIRYNCTAVRLMALACLDNQSEESLETAHEAFLIDTAKRLSSGLPTLKALKDSIEEAYKSSSPVRKRGDQYFYKLLVSINFEVMQKFSRYPYKYSFLKIFSPDNAINIIDKRPFVGTQTMSYLMLNDLFFQGASLDPQISAHGYDVYKGSFGFLYHDDAHRITWTCDKEDLRSNNLYHRVMSIFIDIYDAALEEKELKEQKKLFDFLFILMHEDSPIQTIVKNLKGKKEPVSKEDIFKEFSSYKLPGSSSAWVFKELGSLIASNGYPEVKNDAQYSKNIHQFFEDMLFTLREKYRL